MGAGFSHVAGVPLARDLLCGSAIGYGQQAWERLQAVADDYDNWQKSHRDEGAEQYLAELAAIPLFEERPSFAAAVEYLASCIVRSLPGDSSGNRWRYRQALGAPTRCKAHRDFFSAVTTSCSLQAVITTNYDLLAEQALRPRKMARSKALGFRYAGLAEPQVAIGSGVFSVHKKRLPLTGEVRLAKLHGSLNWA